MANKLNISNLYQLHPSQLSKAHFVSLYSENFPTSEVSDFMNQMKGRYIITSFSLLIRLDELSKRLDTNLDLSSVSDEEIILRSYLKWGKDMVHQLDGDWAFAIWDQSDQELFLARNPHGDGTLFYYHNGSKIFFSSMLTGLVDIEGIPNELDKEKLFMECLTASGFQSRTLYKNIHFLKPGHYMTVSEGNLQLSQYWNPLEKPKVNFKKDEEYFEAFYETYDRAVRDRLALSNRWGFAISGGLDSAATMGLASNYLKERNETAEALCFVPTYKKEKAYDSLLKYGDETEFAQATADLNGNVNLNLVTKDHPLWDFMIRYSQDFGTPPHMAGVYYAEALAEAAKNKQMSKVMIGQGGNQCLSFEGVSSHISLSQYRQDLKHGLGDNLSSSEFTKFLLRSAFASGKKMAKVLSKANKKAIARTLYSKTLLSPDFIKSVNGYDLLEAHYFGKNKQLTEGEFKFTKRLKPGSHCRLGLWNQLGARYDIVFVDPCRDKRFLELTASFPNHIFNRKGEPKFLFKQAFKHIIPSKVMQYKKEGINLSDLPYRYQRDMDQLKSLISSKQNASLFNDLMDQNRLKSFCQSLEERPLFPKLFANELYHKSPSLFHSLLT